ncbi:MAG: lysophospholipid acyltransferase family protein [Elusimicrobiota bacterium]|jgi:predicted LPLAT superfamily acyltransferase|nr:lysophospholipid acyltransferase family protein [Elusimicrobiota bacterium]
MVQKWTGKSRSKSFFHTIQIIFIKIGARSAAYFFLYFIAAFYTLLPSIRKNSSYYLKKRFSSDGKLKIFFRIYKLNLTFGKILMDRAVFGVKGDIKIISSAANKEKCRDLYLQNKGLIILTAHCGSWQSAMSAFDFIEAEKFVVYHRSKEDIDKHVHELSQKSSPINFIDPQNNYGGSVEIMAALQRGAIVCMMGDRTFGGKNNALLVNFFGEKAAFPFSIYRIAAALKIPIAVIFFPYRGRGKIDSFIADTFFVEDKGRKAENYFDEVRHFALLLEDFCMEYPYQFYNYFNMWEE